MDFFLHNLPTAADILVFGLPALLWGYLCLALAGLLKSRFQLKTGYTRKVFHFLIFAGATLVQTAWGLPALLVFGTAVSAVIFFAVVRGEGNLLYEGIAREKDAPRRTYFVLISYLATLLGGLLSNLCFSQTAIVGYLVTGIADAIAEPVGTRFGRHEYTVFSVRGVPAKRSIEGSLAVFLASFLAIWLWMALTGNQTGTTAWYGGILLASTVCAVVEAVSPHGWDNLTLQLVPSALAVLLQS